MPEVIIAGEHPNERLDQFCTRVMDISRSQIQKLIKDGQITVFGKTVTPHTALKTGDVVFFPELETRAPVEKTDPAPLLNILYEDDDILVINKPAGLLVHQAHPSDAEPTVVDALLERDPAIAEVGDDPKRPGIVHRLDKDVSGVMVIAKTQRAFKHIKQQFQDRTARKEYLALVYGELPKDHDNIDFKIARSRSRGRMVARTKEQEGKEAITEYDVIERFATTTYVRVRILTGRTHQIRVHFRAIDHPLVGDKLYKKTRMKNIRPIELKRIFLHATSLTIRLMDNRERTFSSPLPSELESILKSNV